MSDNLVGVKWREMDSKCALRGLLYKMISCSLFNELSIHIIQSAPDAFSSEGNDSYGTSEGEAGGCSAGVFVSFLHPGAHSLCHS